MHHEGVDDEGVVDIAEEGNLLLVREGLDIHALELCRALQVVLKLGAAANGSVVYSLGVGQGVGHGAGQSG